MDSHKNGNFTVKSGYRKLVNIKTNAAAFYDPELATIWKHLWSLDTLPRIKTFLWKCVNDIVPSSERMNRVMHSGSDYWSMCHQVEETTKHIIWDCPFARAVWTSIPGARRSMENSDTSVDTRIISWFTNDFTKLDAVWIVKMANATWEIWKERCGCVFDGKKPNDIEVIRNIQHINNMTGSSMKRTHRIVHINSSVYTTQNKWIPPAISTYSMCCDASFKVFSSINHTGI
ncbi:uncharacterized protein LOC113280177 [Papaver somniferum]|uniref:uncharacterized protein LOC113280177 n=1 Tax=Papaver somniferum TaxID=3469 RepID=UPI000E6F75FB|nr:uncharacterized protein LOC113280177 [Papaver somniferum]